MNLSREVQRNRSWVVLCCLGLDLGHKVVDIIICLVTLTLEEGCTSLYLIYTRRRLSAFYQKKKEQQQQQLWYQVKTKEKPQRANPLALLLKTVETTVFIKLFFCYYWHNTLPL